LQALIRLLKPEQFSLVQILPHRPRRLDATGAFDLCGDIDFHTMNDHKVVLVIREIGILF
jgi:hypothetical protein